MSFASTHSQWWLPAFLGWAHHLPREGDNCSHTQCLSPGPWLHLQKVLEQPGKGPCTAYTASQVAILKKSRLHCSSSSAKTKAAGSRQCIHAELALVLIPGALKARPCCLQSPLDAAHICCSTVHLNITFEKIRRVLQRGVQSLVSLHTCTNSQQRHSSVLWLGESVKGVTCVLMINIPGWPL